MAARVSPVLEKAEDLLGRRYGRKPIADKEVPFIERTPLALKNIVSNQSSKTREKACMNEMMELVACLGKFDQNEGMCGKERTSFDRCFKTFKTKQAQAKAFRESGELPVGSRAKFTGPQLNKYMANFPQSGRTGQFNNERMFRDES